MGFICTKNREEDRRVEAELHTRLDANAVRGEWFRMDAQQVLDALHSHATNAFLATKGDPFEIMGFDGDAIPIYASPWHWGEFEVSEFCPVCGWACGWTYVETAGGRMCLKCGAHETRYEDGREDPEHH